MTEIIQIGGQERPIRFCRNAYSEYEELTGLSLLNVANATKHQSFKALRAMVFVALKWGLYKDNGVMPKPDFTELNVGDWLDDDAMVEGGPSSKVMACFVSSMPQIKNVEGLKVAPNLSGTT